MVGKIGISAQTSSTSVLFCCAASSNGWNSSICGPVAQSVQLSRKVSGLFQSCCWIPEISTHAPLACSWSAASGDKCSKMNVLEDPCSFTKLLSPEPQCAELLLNIPNLGPQACCIKKKSQARAFKLLPQFLITIATNYRLLQYALSQYCPQTFVAASDTSLVAGGHGPNVCKQPT